MKKTLPLISQGTSMRPLLLNNDLIISEPVKKTFIKVDDIVTIKNKTSFTTHRVIYINNLKKKFIAKGDNNLLPDEATSLRKVSGRVRKVIRSGKLFFIDNLYQFQSSIYYSEIAKINSLLSKRKVQYIFLKGLPTHLHYFKKPPRRVYSDCDLLIGPHQLAAIDRLFLSLGYQKQNITHNRLLDKFLKNKAEFSYWKTINKVRVVFDIHLEAVFFFVQTNNLTPLYPYSLVKKFSNYLLSSRKTVMVNEQIYPFLTVENQIIYLALHLFHDNYCGYHKYLLLEQVVNSSKLNEQQIIKIIKEYQLENFLYPCFALLMKHYNPKLSRNFLKQISPDPNKLRYINNLIAKLNIFQDERHTLAGIRRFKNIYQLSNTASFKKPLVFLKPGIALLILFTLIKKLVLIIRFSTFKFPFEKRGSTQPLAKKASPQPAAANQNQPSH